MGNEELDFDVDEAIGMANIPALLPMLVQLTGELKWIEEPYRPRRGRGVDDNDSGGLAPELQEAIRSAAAAAVKAYLSGAPAVFQQPSADLCVRLLECAMGEQIPADYAPLIAAHLPDTPKLPLDPIKLPENYKVLIVGAGVSGIGLGINLKRAGVPFEIIERSTELGGVWRDNAYPGAGVDTPNHIYAFSFAPNDWSMYYAMRGEIIDYLDRLVDQYSLKPHVRLGTKCERATYNPQASKWHVQLRRPDGTLESREVDILISCVGAFSTPKSLEIPGFQSFQGVCVHTARWPEGLSTVGKRVSIIGNGASAMQVGPEIHARVRSLTIFQREPQWVAPTNQFRTTIPEPLRRFMRAVPYYRAWYRMRLAWTFGDRLYDSLQIDAGWGLADRSLNAVNESHRSFFENYIRSELVGRPDLIAKVTPTYPPYGKRMLMDNGWYKMLMSDHVDLVTDSVTEIGPDKVVTSTGREYKTEILVLATGFDMRWLSSFELVGIDGRRLRDAWNDVDAAAYLGTAIPGFPNFVCIYGPNLQLGHGGSWIEILEFQIRYVLDMLREIGVQGIQEFDCRSDVFQKYDEEIVERHSRMVWAHRGMSTYYRNKNGRVTVNSPLRMADLYSRLSKFNVADYKVKFKEHH